MNILPCENEKAYEVWVVAYSPYAMDKGTQQRIRRLLNRTGMRPGDYPALRRHQERLLSMKATVFDPALAIRTTNKAQAKEVFRYFNSGSVFALRRYGYVLPSLPALRLNCSSAKRNHLAGAAAEVLTDWLNRTLFSSIYHKDRPGDMWKDFLRGALMQDYPITLHPIMMGKACRALAAADIPFSLHYHPHFKGMDALVPHARTLSVGHRL